MAEHTPTPWVHGENHSLNGYADINHVIQGADGRTVAAVYANCFDAPHMNMLPRVTEAEHNAEIILRAVNSHHALVKALDWAMARIIRKAPHFAVEGDGELYSFAEAHSLLAKLKPVALQAPEAAR